MGFGRVVVDVGCRVRMREFGHEAFSSNPRAPSLKGAVASIARPSSRSRSWAVRSWATSATRSSVARLAVLNWPTRARQTFVVAGRPDDLCADGAEAGLGVGTQSRGHVGERALALGVECGADPIGEAAAASGASCLVGGEPVGPAALGACHEASRWSCSPASSGAGTRASAPAAGPAAAEDGPAARTRAGAPGQTGDHGHGGLLDCWK
jgi:hypothetical protein